MEQVTRVRVGSLSSGAVKFKKYCQQLLEHQDITIKNKIHAQKCCQKAQRQCGTSKAKHTTANDMSSSQHVTRGTADECEKQLNLLNSKALAEENGLYQELPIDFFAVDRKSQKPCQTKPRSVSRFETAALFLRRFAGMGKAYAVRVGRQPGIYWTWDSCRQQVHTCESDICESNSLDQAVCAYMH
jgi:hypothetical protein